MKLFPWKAFTCLVVLAILFSFLMHGCYAVDKPDADKALKDVAEGIVSACLVVAEAENAGANVSELLADLESATAKLAEAYNAYRAENYDGAYFHAQNCSSIIANTASEAAVLKSEAQQNRDGRLFLTAALSSVGLSMLFVLGLFFWRFMKDRYLKKVLEMKPELEGTE
ncbi:MAG: hypothetical protein QHH24_00915 [Candidatus Bathyarchaeota archaeon]|nr:hypothetical protein [Candidatus Bathyarchaeota archaeon]